MANSDFYRVVVDYWCEEYHRQGMRLNECKAAIRQLVSAGIGESIDLRLWDNVIEEYTTQFYLGKEI